MDRDRPTRRAVLASLGTGAAIGAGAVAGVPPARRAAAQETEHVISINSPSDVPVEYTFTTSGPVEKSTDVPSGLSHDAATIDDDDRIDGRTVSGLTQGGVDSYRYTGEITAFSATNCEEANVWVDGARIDACEYPETGADPTEHVLSINSPSDERIYYALGVASSVEKSSAVPPGVPHDRATTDPADEVDGTVVRGFTQGGVDTYVYDELTAFSVTSGSCDAANVWIDEERVDACALDRQYPAPGGGGGGGGGTDPAVITSPTVIDEPGTYAVGSDFAAGDSDYGIAIRADDVTLEGRGNCVDGGGATDSVGVRVAGSGVTLRNVCVEGWETCVLVTADGAALVDSSLSNAGMGWGTGLHLDGVADANVSDNEITGSVTGIAFEDISRCTFADNEVGTVGSEAVAGSGSTNDEFRDNSLGGLSFAVTLGESQGTVFRGNQIDGGPEDTLSIYRSSDVEIVENTTSGGSGAGISLSETTGSVVRANDVSRNGSAGILLDSAASNVVVANDVRDNCRSSDRHGGITLFDADENEVSRNTLCNAGAPEEILVDADSTDNVIEENDTC